MSLNWQFTDKERFKGIKGDPMNDLFIWGCMMVDLGQITEKNAVEWQKRYALYDRLYGPFYYADKERTTSLVPTLEQVKARIGLTTNVTNRTTAQFMSKVWKHYKTEVA